MRKKLAATTAAGADVARQTLRGANTGEGPAAHGRRLRPPFPIYLSERWRVVDDPLQWILQRRSGRTRKLKCGADNGWRNCRFPTTRGVLLRDVREIIGVDADLGALPDVHSGYQAHHEANMAQYRRRSLRAGRQRRRAGVLEGQGATAEGPGECAVGAVPRAA